METFWSDKICEPSFDVRWIFIFSATNAAISFTPVTHKDLSRKAENAVQRWEENLHLFRNSTQDTPAMNRPALWSRQWPSRLVRVSAATWARRSLSFTTCWGGSVVLWALVMAFYFKSLIGSPPTVCNSQKTACVPRPGPLSIITNLLWTFWHAQGDGEVLGGGKWRGGEDNLIINQLDGSIHSPPPVTLIPPSSHPSSRHRGE